MARTRTLAQIREEALLLADMPNTTFATSAEATRRVNLSIARLWDRIVQKDGGRYFKEPRTVSTVAGVATTEIGTLGSSLNALAGSFYRLVSLDVTVDGEARDIKRLPDWELRHELQNVTGWGSREVFYEMEAGTSGQRLRWFPTPDAVHTVTAWVIPTAPILVQDSDTFDGINGWEDWVAHDVAIYLLGREESDPSLLMAERQRIEDGIISMISGRDASEPHRPRSVRRRRMYFGADGRGTRGWD